jgi:lipopolysaccharide/colanic/teichoic acid biosynthesis glycosyltransferase
MQYAEGKLNMKLLNGSGDRSERLEQIIKGEIKPNLDDISQLFAVCRQSESWIGERPSLKDFGNWIAGLEKQQDGTYKEVKACEVTW